MKARPHQPTPFRLGLRSGADSPPAMPDGTARLRSLRSPLSAPPLALRLHPASKRGPRSPCSLGGCRLVQARQGGGRELGSDWETEKRKRSIPPEGGEYQSIPTRQVPSGWFETTHMWPHLTGRQCKHGDKLLRGVGCVGSSLFCVFLIPPAVLASLAESRCCLHLPYSFSILSHP